MNANRRRGEIIASLNGKKYRLCLTLRTLAELEDAYGVDNLSALVERLSNGNLSSRDMIRILGAGLRGAGEDIDDASVSDMQADNAAAYARAASQLLIATFGTESQDKKNP